MNNVLKSMRLNIGIFGKRNVGKSSLINFLTNQNISIVSDTLGTTTDPVEKVMELLPIGPVVFIDTAGIDDNGVLGKQRIEKTFGIINRIDIALVVCDYSGINNFERDLFKEFDKRNIPFAILINKSDIKTIENSELENIKKITGNYIVFNTKEDKYANEIKKIILKLMPENFFDEEIILNDIIEKNDTVIQVIPIDKEAPKGRLILPQVRTIRNILDIGANSLITNDENLKSSLENLKTIPKLVITDSQVFKKVSETVSEDILMTSYSIVFARLKGDLKYFSESAEFISKLNDGDKVLICESCTHNTSCEDIGRVKLPALLKKFTGKNLDFEFASGHDFPVNIEKYALIVHCGGCMTNKREILSRIILTKEKNIPMTNYGIAIAYCLGILKRAIKPFLG